MKMHQDSEIPMQEYELLTERKEQQQIDTAIKHRC
jgi:hypothetical protein